MLLRHWLTTRLLHSFVCTLQLICAFDFTSAIIRFSHDPANYPIMFKLHMPFLCLYMVLPWKFQELFFIRRTEKVQK